MKKWFEQFKTEDWVVVAVSILLLAFAIITPNYLFPVFPNIWPIWNPGEMQYLLSLLY